MNLNRIDSLLYHHFYPQSTDQELLDAIQIGVDLAAGQVDVKRSIELAQKLRLKLELQSPEKGYFNEFVMMAAYEPDLPGIKIFSDSLKFARKRLHQTGLDSIFEDVTSILIAHEIFHHLEYTHRVTSSLSEVSAHSFAQAFCHLKQSPILINYLLMLKENDLPNQQNIQETSQWLQKKLAKAG